MAATMEINNSGQRNHSRLPWRSDKTMPTGSVKAVSEKSEAPTTAVALYPLLS